jgi:5'-3' exonuclease
MKTLVVIDLDSIGWTVAGGPIFKDLNRDISTEPFMRNSLKKFINSIFLNTKADSYIGFYQGPGHKNFRKNLNPFYKSNRKEKPEFMKIWEPVIFETLKEYPGFVNLRCIESDDALRITNNRYKSEYNIILSHADKDLKCIPGNHFNYKKALHFSIKEEEALINEYAQFISGDSTDGVPGIYGIGPAKAAKLVKKHNMKFVAAFKDAYYSTGMERGMTWRKLLWTTYHSIRILPNIEGYKRFSDVEEMPLDVITDVIKEQKRPTLDNW